MKDESEPSGAGGCGRRIFVGRRRDSLKQRGRERRKDRSWGSRAASGVIADRVSTSICHGSGGGSSRQCSALEGVEQELLFLDPQFDLGDFFLRLVVRLLSTGA